MTRTIPTSESLTVEFKSDGKGGLSDHDLVLAVTCLANAQGGTLYLGVENDGQVTGLTPRHRDGSGMAAMVFNHTSPPLNVRVSIAREEGQEIAVIEIPRAERPVANHRGTYQRRRIRSDGQPECAPFLHHEHLSRAGDLGQIDYSAFPVSGASMADFDPLERRRLRNAIERYYGDRALLDLSDDELDGALRLVADGVPTVAGLLLLGNEGAIRKHLPSHEVAFQVLSDERGVLVNDWYRGPLIDVFEKVEQQFLSRLVEQEVQVGLFRVPVPEVDRRTFREALVNAITHRDWARLGAIHVQWMPEVLWIANPGGFVDGVTPDNVLVATPTPRNFVLADAFKRIGLAERTGRGVDTIFAGMLRTGRAAPSYRMSTPTSVRVDIPCGKADLALVEWIVEEERRRGVALPLDALLILACARAEKRVDLDAIVAATQRPRAAARAAAEKLVEGGLLSGHGTRGRTYTLSPSAYRALGQKAASVRQAGFDQLQQEEMVRSYVRQHGQIRRAEAAELCRIAPREAGRLLKRLEARETLVRHGQVRWSYYTGGPKL